MKIEPGCYVIAGHYGSGKTEVADNLALCAAGQGMETAIADLDIVNPYFRTRECEDALRSRGIKVISSNFYGSRYEDTPGLSPEIASCFLRRDRVNIIDLGGDPAGARVLGRYKLYLPEKYEMWLVLNKNRAATSTVQAAKGYLRDIEAAAGLRFTGIINNTHFCGATTAEDITTGSTLALELSALTGLPVIASCFAEGLGSVQDAVIAGEAMPLRLLHRPRWMSF